MNNPPMTQPPTKRGGGKKPSVPPSAPATDDWIVLGEIAAPFGLKGDVKLLAQTDFPDRLIDHATLYLGPDHRPYPLQDVRPHGGVVLLHFAGVEDINAAETLRGLSVAIPATEAAPLAADQYYIHDLIGLRAIHLNGKELGIVADVLSGAAQDLLVIRRAGATDVLVPLVKALVPTVDLASRTVTIDPPLGLFDDEWIEA
jgi:16S rRNA processing protein RimM